MRPELTASRLPPGPEGARVPMWLVPSSQGTLCKPPNHPGSLPRGGGGTRRGPGDKTPLEMQPQPCTGIVGGGGGGSPALVCPLPGPELGHPEPRRSGGALGLGCTPALCPCRGESARSKGGVRPELWPPRDRVGPQKGLFPRRKNHPPVGTGGWGQHSHYKVRCFRLSRDSM